MAGFSSDTTVMTLLNSDLKILIKAQGITFCIQGSYDWYNISVCYNDSFLQLASMRMLTNDSKLTKQYCNMNVQLILTILNAYMNSNHEKKWSPTANWYLLDSWYATTKQTTNDIELLNDYYKWPAN